jgi:hypothetical protein
VSVRFTQRKTQPSLHAHSRYGVYKIIHKEAMERMGLRLRSLELPNLLLAL